MYREPGVDPVMVQRLKHLVDGHLQDSDRGLRLLLAATGQQDQYVAARDRIPRSARGCGRFGFRVLESGGPGKHFEHLDARAWFLDCARKAKRDASTSIQSFTLPKPSNAPALLGAPGFTIRHVDLKAWMIHFYPDQRPAFLFDAFKRHLHPAVSVDTVQALIMDREALKFQLADRVQTWDAPCAQFQIIRWRSR